MKETLLRKLVIGTCGMVVLGIMGCAPSIRQSKSGESYYLKYNFHYTAEKGRVKGSVANYTRMPSHKILPYGSVVKIGSGNQNFKLIDENSGKRIDVLAKNKFLAGKSISDYLDLILSTVPVSYTGLSEIDQKGISEGKPYEGMSKKGIMIALGYPCPHKTASPDVDVWYYWQNRFNAYAVNFENGLVVSSGY
jgi:hypothetical protein